MKSKLVILLLLLLYLTSIAMGEKDTIYFKSPSSKQVKIPENIEDISQLGLKIKLCNVPNDDGGAVDEDECLGFPKDLEENEEVIFTVMNYESSGDKVMNKFKIPANDKKLEMDVCPLGDGLEDLSNAKHITIISNSSIPYDTIVKFDMFECPKTTNNSVYTIIIFVVIGVIFIGIVIFAVYVFAKRKEYNPFTAIASCFRRVESTEPDNRDPESDVRIPFLMEEEYDCIALGTGITECILSRLLSVSGKKVLHMDKSKYRGGESATLSLDDLFKRYNLGQPDQDTYGKGTKEWYVDLIPKFLLANGMMVKILKQTNVVTPGNAELKSVEGNYAMHHNGKCYNVHADAKESSDFMWPLQKGKFKDFLKYVQEFNEDDTESWKDVNPHSLVTEDLFKKFGLKSSTWDFAGHAIALYTDEEYLKKPCIETIRRIKLYSDSMAPDRKSPYLYPLEKGLGKLLEGFARLSPILMDKPVDEIVMKDGKAVGVKSGGKTIRAKQVYCDPTYMVDLGKTKKIGQVVRCICIMDHPIQGMIPKSKTGDSPSSHIIIPQNQAGRKSDIYVTCLSQSHEVAGKGWFIATVSTTVETDDPEAEIEPGIKLLGKIEQNFVQVTDLFEPVGDGVEDQIFISKSYDATSNFLSTCEDVMDIFKRGTGTQFELEETC